MLAELIRKCVDENAHVSVDPKAYAEKYEALADRYSKAKEKIDEQNADLAKRTLRKEQIEDFLQKLETADQLVPEFDLGIWNAVIEKVTVYSKQRLVFCFKGGTEIEWALE